MPAKLIVAIIASIHAILIIAFFGTLVFKALFFGQDIWAGLTAAIILYVMITLAFYDGKK